MAITRVQSKTADSGATGVASLDVILDVAPTAANYVVLVAGIGVSSTGGIDLTAATGRTSLYRRVVATLSTNLFLVVCRIFSGSSATFTITTSSANGIAIVAAEYAGLSGVFDRYAEAIGSSTSPDSGTATTSDSGNQLWIGGIAVRQSLATITSPANGFAIVGQAASSTGTISDREVVLLEKIVSTTGAAHAAATLSSSQPWAAAVLGLEAASTVGGGGGGGVSRGRML